MQPALSVGNAGQLAVDLLICRTASKAGYLEEPHVLPCVGNDPFGPSADGDLAVALEGTFKSNLDVNLSSFWVEYYRASSREAECALYLCF